MLLSAIFGHPDLDEATAVPPSVVFLPTSYQNMYINLQTLTHFRNWSLSMGSCYQCDPVCLILALGVVV